ncbi:MAG: hypothetical protein KKF78_04445 [Candidatus Omnitrophica bacterium]|nr:hypothetical protein [Candidatus Omnitrophota bacterium]MBU1996390.1 hypothetical protein [Candidatus Omnitrophota bacterium]
MLRTQANKEVVKVLPVISCLLIVVVLSAGCQPLKQKFTRKKKDKSSSHEFIPVLDPIDYGPATVTAKDRYSKHYSLYRVWRRDFVQGLGDNSNEKKIKYLVDQMLVNLTEMQRWIVEEKRIVLNEYILETKRVRTELDKPFQMISIERLKRRIDRNGKKLTREMNPDAMETFYIQK